MALSILLAGHIGTDALEARRDVSAASIQPRVNALARAQLLGLTFPRIGHPQELAIANAQRDILMIEAGIGTKVTLVAAPSADAEIVATNETIPTEEAEEIDYLAKLIVATPHRMEGRILRSRSGESVPLPKADPAAQLSIPTAPAGSQQVALASDGTSEADAGASIDISAKLAALAHEAQYRHGRSQVSIQAMRDYLSVTALRGRAEAVGQLLAGAPTEKVGGFWSASLSESVETVMFSDAMGLDQEARGAIMGYDAGANDVLLTGDRFVYGGFAAAFSAVTRADAPWLGRRNDAQGGSLGLFASLDHGSLNVSALLQADFAMTRDWVAPNRLDVSGAMSVMKAEIVARHRTEFADGSYLEPSVGVSYLRGSFETRSVSQGMRFEEADLGRVQLGVKAGAVVYQRANVWVEPSVTINLAHEFQNSGDVTFLTGVPSGSGDPLRNRTVGSVSVNVDVVDTDLGVTGFVKADGQVSDDDKASVGVSVGAKAKW